MNSGARIYIFNKDDSGSLQNLISDLISISNTIDRQLNLIIIDDSTTPAEQQKVRSFEDQLELPVTIIQRAEQISLMDKSRVKVSSWIRRNLGSKGFDLATCRNLALQHALRHNDPKQSGPILFLDGDIRLRACEVGGVRCQSDGRAALEGLIDASVEDDNLIVGVPLVGRADLSFFEHIDVRSSTLTESVAIAASFAKSICPPVISSAVRADYGTPLGISGGAMCFSQRVAALAPMINCYNEDILWLHYLRHVGCHLKVVDHPLVHADGAPIRISEHLIELQIFGELLWDVVDQSGWFDDVNSDRKRAWLAAITYQSALLRIVAERINRSFYALSKDGIQWTGMLDTAKILETAASRIETRSYVECEAAIQAFQSSVNKWTMFNN